MGRKPLNHLKKVAGRISLTLIKNWVSILKLRILLFREKGPIKFWVLSQNQWHICGAVGNERSMSPARRGRQVMHDGNVERALPLQVLTVGAR